MRTSEELTLELHRRMKNRRQAKARIASVTGALAFVFSLAAAVLFASYIAGHPATATGAVTGAVTASIFAEQSVLGYVVVGLVAFCLGVSVTVLCHRLKRNSDGGEGNDDRTD